MAEPARSSPPQYCSRADAPVLAFCTVCVLLGVVFRAQDLGFPGAFTFDEHHFVPNARNYLEGKADWNDHPPLGKLLIALGMRVVGDTARAWRLAPLFAGLLNVLLAFFLGKHLFRSLLAGALAATFFAIDGFLIAYSRTALLDGMLLTFFLAAVLCAATFRGPAMLLCGVLVGSAMAVKFSGVTLLVPLGIASAMALWRGRKAEIAACVVGWFLVPLVFLAWVRLGLFLSREPSGWGAAVDWVAATFRQHAVLTEAKNPLVSRWYTWVLPERPILMRHHVEGDWVRVMTSLGNPLLWWGSVLVVVTSAWWLVSNGIPEVVSAVRARSPGRRWSSEGGEVSRLAIGTFWLLAAHVSALTPWILTSRDSYIYHYLPSYAFGLVLLAGWVAHAYAQARFRWLVLVGLVVVVNVSAFYLPLWAQLPISQSALEQRPLWR